MLGTVSFETDVSNILCTYSRPIDVRFRVRNMLVGFTTCIISTASGGHIYVYASYREVDKKISANNVRGSQLWNAYWYVHYGFTNRCTA